MIHKDVCIIGGGPAGLAASLFLSRSGVEHLLIEKGSYPRNKVCGESFDGKVFHLLKELNESWLNELEHNHLVKKCWSYRLINSKGYALPISFPTDQTPRIHIRRNDFDAFLFEKAQQRSFLSSWTDTTVKSIAYQDNGILIESTGGKVFTKLLILATGGLSLLPQRMRQKKSKNRTFLFARGHFKGLKSTATAPQIDIFFIRKPFKGCLLLCPTAQGVTNVEIGMSKSEWAKTKVKLPDLLWQATQNSQIKNRFEKAELVGEIGATAMNLSTRRRHYSGAHYLLAGSAAGAVNPVTGFGVGHAMLMGKLAAQQAAQALSEQCFSAAYLSNYDKQVHAKLKNEILISNWNTRLL